MIGQSSYDSRVYESVENILCNFVFIAMIDQNCYKCSEILTFKYK